MNDIQWMMDLPTDKRHLVIKLQNNRYNALKMFSEGRMEKSVAQRIIAKCGKRIEKISKGARVIG
jgi:hypothetical protein